MRAYTLGDSFADARSFDEAARAACAAAQAAFSAARAAGEGFWGACDAAEKAAAQALLAHARAELRTTLDYDYRANPVALTSVTIIIPNPYHCSTHTTQLHYFASEAP